MDLQKYFEMMDLVEIKLFLSIQVAKSNKEIYMSHRKYALDLIVELDLGAFITSTTPLEINKKLTFIEFDKETEKDGKMKEDPALSSPFFYQRIVCRLLYLTMTRLDTSFVVQSMSQHIHSPKQSHLEAAMKVVRYIKPIPG